MKMWSGRFREPLDAEFEKWQRSIVFDWQLLNQEIAASKAHASTLLAAGILTAVELTELRSALDAIAADHASDAGKAQVRDHATAEDIHHFVEISLVERIGTLGFKLHTGRSRNEQIATDLRLYVREQIDLVLNSLVTWAAALVDKAKAAGETVMPSYTHLQRAEPVLVAHWLLAYVEMTLRDTSACATAQIASTFVPLVQERLRAPRLPSTAPSLRANWDSRHLHRTLSMQPVIVTLFSSTCRHSPLLACTSAGLLKRSHFLRLPSLILLCSQKHSRRAPAPCRKRKTPISLS